MESHVLDVGYDDQIASTRTHGGAARYYAELIGHLQRMPWLNIEPILGWTWTTSSYFSSLDLGKRLSIFETLGGSRPVRRLERVLVTSANARAREQVADSKVIHHTHYDPRALEASKNAKRVVTVFDMIPERFPELFEANPHNAKEDFVANADLILCISQSARDDLEHYYGPLKAPVHVTPLAAAPPRSRESGTQLPRQEVLLFVGRRGGYKDFDVLCEALALGKTRWQLVCVGGGPFHSDEVLLLRRLGIEDRVRQLSASDEELSSWYSMAGLFVFPSRFEGFGLPTVEAMSHGCPVLLANSPAHREVGGSAATYFNVGDAGDLALQIDALVTDQDLRNFYSARGLSRSTKFTWRETARLTAKAYLSLT